LGTPRGISDTTIALTALDSAASRVKARWQDVAVPWGTVYRLRRDTVDMAANGASGAYGAFRVANATRTADGRSVISGGDSYVGVLEFTNPLRARTLVGYGNASQPGSPHRTDQLGLFARKELRTAWRTPAEITAHLERRERF
jgi:acyl-homoserine-lactone acylase